MPERGRLQLVVTRVFQNKKGPRDAVERTSALVVRLAAKVLLGKEALLKSPNGYRLAISKVIHHDYRSAIFTARLESMP